MEIVEKIFGTGKDLELYQMCVRAFVVFFIALAFIRISGMRSIGRKSAFDAVISIMLGAVLSRAVVGASAFWPTVAASLVIVLVHRLLAWLAMKSETIENIVKGERRLLYTNGVINWKNMRRSSVSERDLMESVRLQTNRNTLDDIEEAFMESNGQISVVVKKSKT